MALGGIDLLVRITSIRGRHGLDRLIAFELSFVMTSVAVSGPAALTRLVLSSTWSCRAGLAGIRPDCDCRTTVDTERGLVAWEAAEHPLPRTRTVINPIPAFQPIVRAYVMAGISRSRLPNITGSAAYRQDELMGSVPHWIGDPFAPLRNEAHL
jgi:hypothetical protein